MNIIISLFTCLTMLVACKASAQTDATRAAEPKELYVAEGDVMHIDLYDDVTKIPFDKIESFFKANLK